jgi:hypothetical protein
MSKKFQKLERRIDREYLEKGYSPKRAVAEWICRRQPSDNYMVKMDMDMEEALEQISRIVLDKEWVQILNPYTWKALIVYWILT